MVNGTRSPFSNQIGTDAYYENMGISIYNALEVTAMRTSGPLTYLASYTYSKSYDQTSSIQEQVNPYNYHALDSVSAFDIKHNFVISYNYELPGGRLILREPLSVPIGLVGGDASQDQIRFRRLSAAP